MAAARDARVERRRPPVMSDVARLAGVSPQTVSRVLNDGVVAGTTRERVLEAIKLLDYRPNPAARALVTGRTRTIGVVSFDTTLYGPACAVHGIERAAQDEGFDTVLASLPTLERGEVLRAVRRLQDRSVEGILIIAPHEPALSELPTLPTGVPMVAVEAGPAAGFPVALVDQRAGAAAAVGHLLDLGHETVAHLAGPRDWQEADLRVDGWRDTVLAAGREVREPLHGDWSARSGYELARHLLHDTTMTAVFVANDQMALGLLRAASEAGLRVPEDLSVVGFDDLPESPYFPPPLTTVRQPFEEMGRAAFTLLSDEIAGGVRGSGHIVIAPELVVRASTAPV